MVISSDRQPEHTSQSQQATPSEHNVQFYESDGFLAHQIGAFLHEGLASGEGCIVIGTPEHRDQIERELTARGVRLENARRTRHYVSLDAAEVLARFMVDGMPDPGQCAEVIGTIITGVTRGEPPRHARVFGDRDRLGQVLINLLTNAVKYSPQADAVVVRLSTRAESGTALVEMGVQDFGPGIADEYQAHIFERFYQVPEDVGGAYPGLGIGLYIAREFVERHNGRIWLESAPHTGSTFHVILPCCHDGENGADPASSGETA